MLRFFFQIHFLDINKTVGEETQKSFNNQHGVGKAKFVCCDITSQDKLEGTKICLVFTKNVKKCI